MLKFLHAALVVQAALLQCALPLGHRASMEDDILDTERPDDIPEDDFEDDIPEDDIPDTESPDVQRPQEWGKWTYPVVSMTHNAGGAATYMDEIEKVFHDAKFFEEDGALLGMVCLQEAPGVLKDTFESNGYAKMLQSSLEKTRDEQGYVSGQEWKHLVHQTQDGGTTAGLNHQSLAVFVKPPGDFQWLPDEPTVSNASNASSAEEKEFLWQGIMCQGMQSKTFGMGRVCYSKKVQRNSFTGKGATIGWIRYEDAQERPQFEVVVGCSHLDAGKKMNDHTQKILQAMGPADGGHGLDTRIILGDLNYRLPDASIQAVLKGESEATSTEIIDAITRHLSGQVNSSDKILAGLADLKDADPLTQKIERRSKYQKSSEIQRLERGDLVQLRRQGGAGFTCNSVDFLPPTYKFPETKTVKGTFYNSKVIVGTQSPKCQTFFLRAYGEQQTAMEYRGHDGLKDMVSQCYLERSYADPENKKVWPSKKKKTQVQMGWLDRFCWHAKRMPTENPEFSQRTWIAGHHVTSDHYPVLSKVTFQGVHHSKMRHYKLVRTRARNKIEPFGKSSK